MGKTNNDTPDLPQYIERGGEQSLVPPGMLTSTQFYIFVLRADKEKLQAMADKLFNEPSGGKVDYRALSDYVVLMFTHVDDLSSAQASQGWISYHDIALWVPYVAVEKKLGVEIADRVVMYPPYIFVDNGATMVTGREVFGLPKQMASCWMPQNPNYIGELTTDVMGFTPNSATKQNNPTRLWTVERQASGTTSDSDTDQAHNSLKDVLNTVSRKMKAKAPDFASHLAIPNIPKIIGELVTGVPALGLKQFRDATQVDKACFQAIIEAPLINKKFRGVKFLNDGYKFILNDLASHPVAADTGLKIGEQDVVFSLYLHLDMEMGTGTTIWQSGTD